jgi:cyclophilin family peptidyl-prolyl cis-trans isomerase
VFRHFPLNSIHDKAALAAEATEAAGAQGSFWEMHDLLFERQSEWSGQPKDQVVDLFVGYARDLGLDADRFSREMKEGMYRELVQQRTEEAISAGLRGTPTIYLNGQLYDGPRSDFVLSGLIKLYNYDGLQYAAPPPMIIDPEEPYFVTVETNRGVFCAELFAAQTPKTVNNFVFLAQEGFYNDVLFHRVLPEFVAQTGDPTGSGFGGPGYRFEDEILPELTHDGPGLLSMANSGPNTNGSQFFVTYQAIPDLDGKHTVFGRVVEGMDILAKLTPRDPQQNPYAPADNIIEMTVGSACAD